MVQITHFRLIKIKGIDEEFFKGESRTWKICLGFAFQPLKKLNVKWYILKHNIWYIRVALNQDCANKYRLSRQENPPTDAVTDIFFHYGSIKLYPM